MGNYPWVAIIGKTTILNFGNRTLMGRKKISVLHPYLESRRSEIDAGLYPKNHLWGIDALEKSEIFEINHIKSNNVRLPSFLEKLLDRSIFRNSPGSRAELSTYFASKTSDFVYSVCGPLGTTKLFPHKVISWTFSVPAPTSESSIQLSYRKNTLKKTAGFLCLTPKAENYFNQFATSIFIPWCVDMDLFDGKTDTYQEHSKPFFIATGKTGRDYLTLVKAAYLVDSEVRIIGPSIQKPKVLPSNVTWIDTSSDPPDQAIDYPTLREWYAQCSGVCIPLSGDADDTCGYTNMLEGMAMRKPIIMTRSGCLHIDPASKNFGMLIEPKDSQGWSVAMNRILNNNNFALECGYNGRKIAEQEFSIERFNRDVLSFINEVIDLNG
jgi:glycosyltransferase involved in cell wall biosynthesis